MECLTHHVAEDDYECDVGSWPAQDELTFSDIIWTATSSNDFVRLGLSPRSGFIVHPSSTPLLSSTPSPDTQSLADDLGLSVLLEGGAGIPSTVAPDLLSTRTAPIYAPEETPVRAKRKPVSTPVQSQYSQKRQNSASCRAQDRRLAFPASATGTAARSPEKVFFAQPSFVMPPLHLDVGANDLNDLSSNFDMILSCLQTNCLVTTPTPSDMVSSLSAPAAPAVPASPTDDASLYSTWSSAVSAPGRILDQVASSPYRAPVTRSASTLRKRRYQVSGEMPGPLASPPSSADADPSQAWSWAFAGPVPAPVPLFHSGDEMPSEAVSPISSAEPEQADLGVAAAVVQRAMADTAAPIERKSDTPPLLPVPSVVSSVSALSPNDSSSVASGFVVSDRFATFRFRS